MARQHQQKKRHTPPPVAVFVDRSRDLTAARDLIGLEPDDVYHTTDNRATLKYRTLKSYDVLVIAGHGPATYTPSEMDAIVRFVRSGGGLLLAGSTGVFEHCAKRPVEEMAACAIGRRFGIEFLSPAEAAGRPRRDVYLIEGYPHGSIRLGRSTVVRDLRRDDVHLDIWSPVRPPRQGDVIMSHRATGEAAAVTCRFGKGRIVAVGGVTFIGQSPRLLRKLIDHLAAGRPRRTRARRLPHEIPAPQKTRRCGNIRFCYPAHLKRRVPAVLRMVRKVVPALDAMIPAKKTRKWTIELAPSCTASSGRWRRTGPAVVLGVDASDEELAFALGAGATETLAWSSPAGRVLGDTVFGGLALFSLPEKFRSPISIPRSHEKRAPKQKSRACGRPYHRAHHHTGLTAAPPKGTPHRGHSRW